MSTPLPPRPVTGFDPLAGQTSPSTEQAPATPPQQQLIAPIWHTVAIVAIILANSYFASVRLPNSVQRGRILLYLSTMVWQVVLLGLVWIGLRLRKTTLRELIGGRWNSAEAFWLDVGVAAGFWFVSAMVLVGAKIVLGLSSLDVGHATEQAKKAVGSITPRTLAELAVFLLLTLFAGFVEETIFRGYLQKQIGAITGNVYAGLVVSAIVFGAAHGYQGTRYMILIAIYGVMFGLLVLWRKSLRPGMMAHAWQDALSGVTIYVLTRLGKM
jgi:membrane protease YdiL (CAAX protease family)